MLAKEKLILAIEQLLSKKELDEITKKQKALTTKLNEMKDKLS